LARLSNILKNWSDEIPGRQFSELLYCWMQHIKYLQGKIWKGFWRYKRHIAVVFFRRYVIIRDPMKHKLRYHHKCVLERDWQSLSFIHISVVVYIVYNDYCIYAYSSEIIFHWLHSTHLDTIVSSIHYKYIDEIRLNGYHGYWKNGKIIY
jgi:hypothetical protein